MAEQNSLVMNVVFDTNAVVCDTAKNGLEYLAKTFGAEGSAALKAAGMKMQIIGNIDKMISVKVSWDSGDPKEIGKEVFKAVGGVVGGVALGRLGGAAGSLGGPLTMVGVSVVGGYVGDKGGSWAGEKAWEYLYQNREAIMNFPGVGDIRIGLSYGNELAYGHANEARPEKREAEGRSDLQDKLAKLMQLNDEIYAQAQTGQTIEMQAKTQQNKENTAHRLG